MANFRAQIQVYGDVQFDREIQGVGRRATKARPLYEELGWWLSNDVMREQFATEGARSGHPWAANEPETDARKVRLGQPLRIFEATSELKESFKLWDDLNIYEATDDYLRWGSASEHGQYHQPDAKDRRVFALTEEDRRYIVKQMQRWVVYGELS